MKHKITEAEILAEIASARRVTCDVPSCLRPPFSRGLCAAHAQQMRRSGKVTHETINGWSREWRECVCPDCDDKGISRGMCAAHYQKYLRTGADPATMQPIKRRTRRT